MASVSAGILLYRRPGDSIEVLLVHPGGPFWARKDARAWSIPKGLVEPEEETRACALRELAEELGPAAPELDPESLVDLGSVRQKSGKVVHCWAVAGEFDPAELDSNTVTIEWPPRSGRQAEFPEVDRAAWFGVEEAREKLIAAQVGFLDRLGPILAAR